MKKLWLLSLVALAVILNVRVAHCLDDSPLIVGYQEKLQQDLTTALSRIIDEEKFVVSLRVKIKDEMKIHRYLGKSQVAGNSTQKGFQIEEDVQIMPGIPDEDASKVDPQAPYDSVSKMISQRIDKITVMLVIDGSLSRTDVKRAEDLIGKFLGLNPRQGDRIEVIRENFVIREQQKDNPVLDQLKRMQDQLSSLMSQLSQPSPRDDIGRDGTSAAKPLPEPAEQPEALSGDREQQDARAKEPFSPEAFLKKNAAMIGVALVVLVILILCIIVLIIAFRVSGKEKVENQGTQSQSSHSNLEQKITMDIPEEREGQKEQKVEQAGERRYFDFVNAHNIDKLYHLLHVKIALNEASTKTVAMVMSLLDHSLQASLLLEFPVKIQAELMKILSNYEQFSIEEIDALDKELRDGMYGLVGGQNILVGILDSISENSKSKLIEEIGNRYPETLKEMRDLVVLFEDVIMLPDVHLLRVLEEIDLEVIAKAVADNEEWQEVVLSIMPSGRKLMLQQIIEFSKGYTLYEKENAKRAIIEYAKKLDREAVIQLQRRM